MILALVTERISGHKLTGPPVQLRRISKSLSSIMVWTYLVYSENVLIHKINSNKLNHIFFIYDSYSHSMGGSSGDVSEDPVT